MLQKMLRQLRTAFLDELPERLDMLDNLLLGMEKQGAATEEEFNELYRGVHSIKGSGGTHGLHIISTICHQFEDSLKVVSDNLAKLPQGFIDNALTYTGLLRMVVGEAQNGSEAFLEVEKRLLELHNKGAAVKYSILMVEASHLSSKIFTQALADLPVNIVVVEDGHFALLRALNEHFNILITSQEVPMLSGRAIVGALRLSDSPNRNIKTILITASSEAKHKVNRAIDASYIIVKDRSCVQNLHDTVAKIIAELNKGAAKPG